MVCGALSMVIIISLCWVADQFTIIGKLLKAS